MSFLFPASSCKITITNDAIAALTSGTFTQQGLVVIAGTGSIVYGVGKNHQISRVGGWGGYLLGDEAVDTILGKRHCVILHDIMMHLV